MHPSIHGRLRRLLMRQAYYSERTYLVDDPDAGVRGDVRSDLGTGVHRGARGVRGGGGRINDAAGETGEGGREERSAGSTGRCSIIIMGIIMGIIMREEREEPHGSGRGGGEQRIRTARTARAARTA